MHQSKSSAFDFGRLARFGVFKLSGVVALAMLGLVGSQPAEAAIIIPTPAGLNPGDTFRIAFVTDATTQAISTDINTYNNFVNTDATTEAGGGTVTYAGIPLTFSAIASTAALSAISNIGVTGAPVYLASGTEVDSSDTTGIGGLWSGSLLSPLSEDLIGTLVSTVVWTGTNPDGTVAGLRTLGSTVPLTGDSPSVHSQWIGDVFEFDMLLFPLYGISQPLTVPAPEPSTLVLACLAAVGLAVCGRRRRQR